MAFTASWSVIAGEVPTAAKWTQLGDNDDYLKGEIESNADYLVPSGGIILWSGSVASIPAGYVLCNGSSGTPDLRDRFVIGAGAGYDVGATGGSASVTLTSAQMPTHTHSGSSGNAGSHNHGGSSGSDGSHTHTLDTQGDVGTGRTSLSRSSGASDWRSGLVSTTGAHTHTISTQADHSHTVSIGNAGSGSSHENRPPYYALCFIMKL